MSLILLAALASLQATSAPPRDWEMIYDREGEQIAIDAASLRREGDTVEAWLRGRPRPQADNPLRSLVIHALYDCRASTEITLSLEGFDENGTSLGVVQVPQNERTPQHMGEDAQERAIIGRVCGNDGRAVT